MTTILTWMNGNSHESTYKCPQTCIKVFEQPHCLITSRSFCAWFVSRIQYVCQPIDQHFQALRGKGSLGRVLNRWLCINLFLSSLLCRRHKATRQHTEKSCISECFLPTSPDVPFKYCFSFQTKLNPCMEFRKNLSKCIIFFNIYLEKLITDSNTLRII